ncbi:MAG: hypothetical protein FWG41_02425 [Methanomassiliicoccaceae archaeon]|nr:hypothetical protein [Methanomassiliicoccaceae archaeon]
MKKEMKKNNRMFLALVVVAALAMVSVAGIALSDDSDAALISNNIIIQKGETNTTSYDFYVNEADDIFEVFEFTVKEGGNYTGTIRIGVFDAANNVYVPYCEMQLTNASAVRLAGVVYQSDITDGVVAFFMISNIDKDFDSAFPGGTYDLKQGSVMLGAAEEFYDYDWLDTPLKSGNATAALMSIFSFLQSYSDLVAFNGKITAGDFAVTSAYTLGTMISLDSAGKARFSSLYDACSDDNALPFDPVAMAYPDDEERTLSFEGEASLQYPESIQKLMDKNLGNFPPGLLSHPTWGIYFCDVFSVYGINVTVEDGAVLTAGDRAPTVAEALMVEGTDINWAVLVGENGNVIYNTSVVPFGANDAAVFDYVPLGVYKLLLIQGSTGEYGYFGTATVTAAGITLGPNTLPAVAMPDGDLDDTTFIDQLFYDPAQYTFVYAYNESENMCVGKADVDTTAGTAEIVFDAFTSGDYVFVVMRDRGTLNMVYYLGNVGTNDVTDLIRVTTLGGGTLADDQIRGGNDKVELAKAQVTYKVWDDSDFLVLGEMNFLYEDDLNYAILDITNDAYLRFDGEGIVSQGVLPPATGSVAEVPGIFGSANIVAAYFWENDSGKSTYYFTSLANAVKKSNVITLVGDHVILVDTTLDNPDFDDITIIIGPDATLQVGDGDVTPILTIPAKTEVTNPYGKRYEVVSGQAVYDVKPTAFDEPICDILIEGSKFIYTDLATALDISVSGDVLETLRDAVLLRNATVKSGVTLKDTGGTIEIPEDVTLTVNGTLESKDGMIIKGTLRINSVVDFDGSNVVLEGSIDVTSSGVLNVNDTDIIGTADSVIDIAGEVNLTGTTDVVVGELIVTGTLTIEATAALEVLELLRIGDVPELSTGYVNTADITGKIDLAATAIAWVYGDFGSNVFNNPVDKTEYKIGTTLYLTLYVDSGVTMPLKKVWGDEFGADGYMLDIEILDWNNDRMLRGDWLSEELKNVPTAANIGGTDWEIVYADFIAKKVKVTLAYTLGIEWAVDDVKKDGVLEVDYGTTIAVKAVVQPGYEGTPVLRAGTASYTAGAPYKVTAPVTFSVASGVDPAGSGGSDDGGLTLIEILLIIIVIIIAIIAIIIAIRLLRS